MNAYLNEKYKETERLLKEYIRLKADAKQARQEEDESSEAAQKKKSAKTDNKSQRRLPSLSLRKLISLFSPIAISGIVRSHDYRPVLISYYILNVNNVKRGNNNFIICCS